MRKFLVPVVCGALALSFAGCLKGDTGPVGPSGEPGQDAVVNSYSTTIAVVPSPKFSVTLPAWSTGANVFVTADAWVTDGSVTGWAPINVVWNDGYNVFQATMIVLPPTVRLECCQGLKVRIRAWQFSD